MATLNDKNIRRRRVMEGAAEWAAFYRANIDIFVRDYLQLDFLKWFQYMLLAMMNDSTNFVWIAARGMGKSFLIAIFACVRCILYPGTKVILTAGKRSQSINVLEKIQTELIPKSITLKAEIDMRASKFSGQDAKICFKNGSYIKVVTAADSARSNRANILIVDEFRMIKKDIVDTVLRKFLTSRRMPPYKDLTEAERSAEYAKEPNMTEYLSSAYYKDHWSYAKTVDSFKSMLSEKSSSFVCSLPYQLSIKEGLLFPEDIQDEMMESDFNEIKFSMELGAMFWGGEDGAFFDFGSVSKNRKIPYPMLPGRLASKLGNSKKVAIPKKQNGEKRILSIDVALMSSKKNNNDASALFINQMIPNKVGRYVNNIVYTDCFEGMVTQDQALLVRRLFDEYQCDYLVLDCQGVGMGIADLLIRDMVDPETGELYPAINYCNNKEMADRCTVPGAEKVIYAIKASAQFNSDCAVLLREGFRSGKIRLLDTELDGEDYMSSLPGWGSLNPQEHLDLQMPYINTTLLINELVNLQHDETNGKVKIFEKSNMRKDRFSSLSYNYYVALEIERKTMRRNNFGGNDVLSNFVIKPPRSANRNSPLSSLGRGWDRGRYY